MKKENCPAAKKYLTELDAARGRVGDLLSKKCAFLLCGEADKAEETEREVTRAEENLRLLGTRITALPPCGRKTLLELRYLHGMPPAVIRKSMGLTESAYYSALRRGIALIEKRMGEDAHA